MSAPHVLFFYQHFWPDSPPYASMLRIIGRGLCEAGSRVTMLTAQPSYKATDRADARPSRERVDGIDVRRLAALPLASRARPVALIGKVLFPLRAFVSIVGLRLVGRAPDVVVAATIPPVINGLFGLAAARVAGARFVYHLQDIYPEIGAVGGLWPEGSVRHRVLRAIDGFVTRRADRCVVLSGDMGDALLARGMRAERLCVINNFMLESFDPPDAGTKVAGTTGIDGNAPRRVVFAGNIGRFQALDALLDGFLAYSRNRSDLELHFLGDGAAKADLIERAAGAPGVHFHGHVPFEQAAAFIGACDAGIVSIAAGVHRYAYPSKTLTYLGLGVPVLAVVESDSSLASDIESGGLGVTCAERSGSGLARAFAELADWLEAHPDAHDAVRAWVGDSASSSVAVERWIALLEGLERPCEAMVEVRSDGSGRR